MYRPPMFAPSPKPQFNKIVFMMNFLFRCQPGDVYHHPLFVFVKDMFYTMLPKLQIREKHRSNASYFFLTVTKETIARVILRAIPLVFSSIDESFTIIDKISELAESCVKRLSRETRIDAIKPLETVMDMFGITAAASNNADEMEVDSLWPVPEVTFCRELYRYVRKWSWQDRASQPDLSMAVTRELLAEKVTEKYDFPQAGLLLTNLAKAQTFEKRASEMMDDLGPKLVKAKVKPPVYETKPSSGKSSRKWAFGFLDLPQAASRNMKVPYPAKLQQEPWRIAPPTKKTWLQGEQIKAIRQLTSYTT